MSDSETPRVTREETLFHGRIFDLKRVDLQLADGHVVHREIVAHPGSVGILPVTAEGNFILVRQFRAPAARRLLEAPAGTLEAGEPPEACARRELIEEVGQESVDMRRLAGFYLAPGWANEYMHAYVATGLSPRTAAADDDEDLSVEILSPPAALAAIASGDIADCKTIALIGLYLLQSNRQQPDPWLDENPDEE